MKNYIFISLIILNSVSCTIKQRENKTVWYHHYSIPEIINIKTDYPFLTDSQFNQDIIDTTKMYRLDINTCIEVQKAIYRADYEIAVKKQNDYDKEYYANLDPKETSSIFYIYGKLNLQASVNSLVIFESFGVLTGYTLRLFNIKDNRLCSIVLLDFNYEIKSPDCTSPRVNNGVLTKTIEEERYFLNKYFWHEYPMKDKILFSTYTIDENGYLVFTKDKFYKGSCLP